VQKHTSSHPSPALALSHRAALIDTRRRIATAALILMAGNVASRLLGLLREQVMAWLFGATGGTDAFVAASAVPTMVYDLLVGGAISAALVPVFVEAAEDRDRWWRLVSTVLNLAGLLLLLLAAGLGLLADRLIDVLGTGFDLDQQLAAASMVRVMLVAVVLQGLAGVLMAALYAQNRFALPAFAPAIYNGAMILLALLLHEQLGVMALVAGVLLGAAGQLLLQAAGLRELRYRPRLDLRQAEVRTILKLYGPVAAGLLVAFVGIVLDRHFASQLAAGSMTVMAYATRLLQFPLGLVGTAASLAVLPTLAAHARGMQQPGDAAAEHLAGYRATLRFGLKVVLLLLVPAALALGVLIEPLVRLVFEHRAFTGADAVRTATVFRFYLPQLPLTGLDQVLIYAFYARRDTVTPVLVGVLTVGGYLGTALVTREALGVNGLALANAVQNGSHGLILLGLLGARVGGLRLGELLGFTTRVLLAAVPMAAALWAVLRLVGPQLGATTLGLAALVACEVALGVAVFGGLALALRIPEARQLVELVWGRVRPRN
jgi:putative peptidoglycan lipid II flippase